MTTTKARKHSPSRQNRRLLERYLSILLVGIVCFFSVLGLMLRDRDYSESENRSLAQMPKFSVSALTDGSYLSALGTYVADQFPFRDGWISLNLAMNQALGQKEASGIYLCRDGYLMQIPGESNETQLARNLAAINTFGKGNPNLNIVMSVIPNAVTVHSDKLPNNAPVRDQLADLKNIQSNLTGAKFADVTDILKEHREETLFYRTDHHWTSLGACYALQEIGSVLNIPAPAPSEYTVYTVSDSFEGTLSSKSGSHRAEDVVELFVPKTDIEYYVTYESSQNGICSMYDKTALERKDHYTVFFGGNYGRVDITTTANTHRNLLVIKDSYANCLVPMLYPYFDHITMIDPRYYYDSMASVIKNADITDVLYLYNLDTFLSDSSLADALES